MYCTALYNIPDNNTLLTGEIPADSLPLTRETCPHQGQSAGWEG